MRSAWTYLMCVWLSSLLPVTAEEETTTYAGVSLGIVGTLPVEQVDRVRDFVEVNTSIPVRMLTEPLTADEQHSLGAVLDQFADQRGEMDAALVLIYAGDQAFDAHTVYRYDEGVGIVNATLMQVPDEEQFMRRVEKLAMRSVGLLLDVPLVPNPQSAMWTYRTMDELDFMGRNFDPPSLIKVQENAAALGIPLIEDSPYWLMRN